jgi:signal transduction histidine kinase
VLVVADNGPGIAAVHLPHIFERFYRVDKARTASAGRTGLGLAIVKAIVDAHGGEIEAESTPGAGARFTVRLPAAG